MFQDSGNDVIISIYVQPNASKSCVVGEFNGLLKIKIRAQPEDGKANKEVIDFLSNLLSLPKKRIEFLKGEKSRLKKILIRDMTSAHLRTKLKLTMP